MSLKRIEFKGVFENNDKNYRGLLKGFQQFLDATEGRQVEIKCKEVKVSDTVIRSNEQSRFFHGVVLKAFCRSSQNKYTLEEAKDFLKNIFLSEVIGKMKTGEKDEEGEDVYKTLLRVKETSGLTVAEMSEFITKCIKYMSDNKQDLPDFHMTTTEYDDFLNSVGADYIQHHELRII